MYRLLMADDESIVLESLSCLIDWQGLELEPVGRATDGDTAARMIEELHPDIVITDIQMPGMSGLEMIARYAHVLPRIRFIVLSGHSEFDFANQAMSCGVKHYLLKPCDQNAVQTVLAEAVEELRREDAQAAFIQRTLGQLESVMPYAKEMFFRDAVLAHFHDKSSIEQHMHMYGIRDGLFNLVVLVPDYQVDYLSRFSLKKIAEELLIEQSVSISTVMQDEICLLVDTRPMQELLEQIVEIRASFSQYFKTGISASVSEPGHFNEIRRMYTEAETCLSQRYYLGGDAIILQSDIPDQTAVIDFQFDTQYLAAMVKNGDIEKAQEELARFFAALDAEGFSPQITATKSIEFLIKIIISNHTEKCINDFMGSFFPLRLDEDSGDLRKTISSLILSLARQNQSRMHEQHNSLVKKVLDCIEKNIGNPQLSLSWIAGEILYVNCDYLGRLFLKEVGERFSQYLFKKRMELAKELIHSSGGSLRVYEISEHVGFPENPQYFSQIFKKYTGMTPKEYKKQFESA